MIAEDDTVLQFLSRRQLLSLGWDADVASNGAEAVRLAGLKNYDLILMDVQMPVMDGLEATVSIRSLEAAVKESARNVPIIAVTANPDKKRCLECGMNDFLFKPVLLDELKNILERWVPVNN